MNYIGLDSRSELELRKISIDVSKSEWMTYVEYNLKAEITVWKRKLINLFRTMHRSRNKNKIK